VSFRCNKCSPTSQTKYKFEAFKNNVLKKISKLQKDGARKKFRILHTKKFSGEISAAFTRMFSIVITILKITVSETNYTLLHLKTSCLVSSIFVMMEKKSCECC
jgi:hypothetical protein